MKSNLLLFLLLLTSPLALIAQDTSDVTIKKKELEERPLLKNDIGLTADDFQRIGLSYRHWFGDNKLKNFGFQTSIASAASASDLNIYGSLSFLYKLHSSKYMNLFLYQKNGFSYYEFEGTRSGNPFLRTSRNFTNSIGVGIEVIALQRLSINLSGGYRLNTYNSSQESGNFNSYGLEAELGLFYKF